MFTLKSPDDILEWDLAKIVAGLELLQEETSKYDQEIELVKNGTINGQPIESWRIEQEWYSTQPSTNKAIIKGIGKIPLKDFMDDITRRQTIGRRILLQEVTTGKPTKPRND